MYIKKNIFIFTLHNKYLIIKYGNLLFFLKKKR